MEIIWVTLYGFTDRWRFHQP